MSPSSLGLDCGLDYGVDYLITIRFISYPEWPHRQDGCSHAAVARSSPAEVALIYTMHVALRGWGGGCDQSIGSTVSDAIVRSWLWLTATRSSPLGCFSALLQVVDN